MGWKSTCIAPKKILKEAVKKNYFQKVEFVSNKQKIHSNHKYASHKEKF